MNDEFLIQQTLNQYSYAVSCTNWDQAALTFAPDGAWEIAGLGISHHGRAAIGQAMAAFSGQLEYFVQINSPAIIALDGEKAVARSTVRECGKYKGRDEALEVLGFYKDELVRTDDGWKFARRTFRGAGFHRFALLPFAPIS